MNPREARRLHNPFPVFQRTTPMKNSTSSSPRKVTMLSLSKKLGALRGVSNAPSIRNPGDVIRNQFIIYYDNGEVFQSYNTICGVRVDGMPLALSGAHDYSRTTSAHVGRWCNLSTKERREGMESGEILTIAD